ncbi:MAG: alkaline shock response membrane anchor protein AmaP [Candidatus Omnitrophica bacterium]|nr:alkaline shock response membrane anchor protein AmaP [Candidatus Omnitrophota bacterium]
MKSFFIKIFMVIAAAFCLAEGLVLVAVGLGRLTPEKLQQLYAALLAAPKALSIILGVGLFFVILGFILLILSSRTKPVPPTIQVEKDGRTLNIPQLAVKDFIMQILEQNPYTSDFTVAFERKGKGPELDIMITLALNGVSSIYEELNKIEDVVKTELERVFDLKDFKFVFLLRGVAGDPKKKYFASPESEEQPAAEQNLSVPEMIAVKASDKAATKVASDDDLFRKISDDDASEASDESAEVIEPAEEIEEVEEAEEDDEVPVMKRKVMKKNKSKDASLLSKMLWGK